VFRSCCEGSVSSGASWVTLPRQTWCSGRSHGLQRSWMWPGTAGAEPKPEGCFECSVALLTCPAGAFLPAFLGLISNYMKREKLDGWCHKMPRAQLLVESWCSMEMAHQTTVIISYYPFFFPQSSGFLSSIRKTEMTEKEVPRARKGGKT